MMRIEENSARYGVCTVAVRRDVDPHMSGNIPDQVSSGDEVGAIGDGVGAGNLAGVERVARVRIGNLDGFRPRIVIPVQHVEGNLVCLSIREIQVETEGARAAAIPRSSDPVPLRVGLEVSGIRRDGIVSPDPGRRRMLDR